MKSPNFLRHNRERLKQLTPEIVPSLTPEQEAQESLKLDNQLFLPHEQD